MTVKEFVDVVNFQLIDYAKIYEMRWDEDYQDYDTKFTDKRVGSKKDLEPYYDCELSYFEYETCWGEYDDSSIYIKMPKIVIENPCVKCSLNYDGSCCGCDKGREYKKMMEETK